MTKSTITPVKFTEGAIHELLRIRDNNSDKKLRIGVKGGGCSGMTYILEYDEMQDGDVEYVINKDLSFIIQQAHELYLHNVQVDYQGGLNSRGFTFENPNASATCGCGTSFAV